MHPALRAALALPAIALLGFGSTELVRMIHANRVSRTRTVEALDQAVRITPENADLYARIATLDPSRSDAVQKALARNQHEPGLWIMQSLNQEQSGDVRGAEASLQRAIQVSRNWATLWSLAAFYYRQGNTDQFAPIARQALIVSGGDPKSLFQMADNLKIPPAVVEQQIVPPSPTIVDAYLSFVVEKGDLATAANVARQLTTLGTNANRDTLLAACERLFLAGRSDDAVGVWNSMIDAHWIQMTRLAPSEGVSLTDGGFQYPRIGAGFDWKVDAPRAIGSDLPSGGGIHFDFDGRQPDSEMLSQFVPLLPKRKYLLKTRFQTKGISSESESGLRWFVWSGAKVFATSPSLSSDTSTEQVEEFETPADGPFRLGLMVERLPGTTRIEGQLQIDSVKLELAGAEAGR